MLHFTSQMCEVELILSLYVYPQNGTTCPNLCGASREATSYRYIFSNILNISLPGEEDCSLLYFFWRRVVITSTHQYSFALKYVDVFQGVSDILEVEQY